MRVDRTFKNSLLPENKRAVHSVKKSELEALGIKVLESRHDWRNWVFIISEEDSKKIQKNKSDNYDEDNWRSINKILGDW